MGLYFWHIFLSNNPTVAKNLIQKLDFISMSKEQNEWKHQLIQENWNPYSHAIFLLQNYGKNIRMFET
jgi:hypothetical protein